MHPRGWTGRGTGFSCGKQVPAVGLPGWSPADLATVVPGGVLAFFVACLPFYFSLFSAPLPRRGRISPRPPSRREGGDLRLFYARGSAPCIPGAGRGAALVFPVESRFRRWACPVGRLLTLPLWYPAGGLPSLLPACLFTLACFPAPIPPAPFPSGEGGGLKVILCKGLRPLHPRGCTRAALVETAKQVPGAGGARG